MNLFAQGRTIALGFGALIFAGAGAAPDQVLLPPAANKRPDSVAVPKARDKADWWSWKAASRPSLPEVRASRWVRNPIDRFILARLEREQLAPSPEADRLTLLRRLCFDLTGLPPSPEEADRFLADTGADAYERLVDRLLASPRYGERWARHWLDVVHYGETHGYDKDKPRLNAWPYRDYVIRSFNDDKPYGRFVMEQLAGDALFPDEPDGIVALGFVAAGPWDFVGHVELPESKTDGLIARYNDRDDMVMTTMSTFQSLTVHCARCHDHKFDPISQKEYYGLQAVFAGVDRAERLFDADKQALARRRVLDAERDALESRWSVVSNRVNQLMDPSTRAELGQVTNRLGVVSRELSALPAQTKVYAIAGDFAPNGSFVPPKGPRPVHVLGRGDVRRAGELASPGGLACVSGPETQFETTDMKAEGKRRAALARWIADPKNLLTRRSLVNRVWQYHFGRGIVETPDDFGHMGALPTHPELLDWLAFWFLDQGESLKQLHRLILTSATYRQVSGVESRKSKVESRAGLTARSAALDSRPSTLDSDNRYLWRMNRGRLDAESIRDTILWVGGQLDLVMGGPPAQQFYFKDDHSPVYDYARFDVDSPGSHRRSIYRFIVRSVPDPFMDTLDCPDANLLAPRRNTTTTALQALALLNDPFVVKQAEHFAERVSRARSDLNGRIGMVYRLALCRLPTANESRKLAAYAEQHGLANLCRLIFNSNEFLFVD